MMKLIKERLQATSSKFILFVGDEGAIMVFMEGKKVVRRLYAPSPGPEHVRSLVELMREHPHTPIYMLVDMMDQTYVRHTLPPVSPISVSKMVQRRLDRDFAPEDIVGSLSLGRDKDGRKDWNFLLIALANSPQLQEWLNILLELSNPFKGIHLVPVEAQLYINELSATVPSPKDEREAEWKILVSHNKVGGFRQVVLRNGKLIFTRLAQAVGEAVPDVIAGNVEQEIQNTIEYLRRLSFNEQSGLDIFIVVAQEIKEAIDPGKFKNSNVHLFTPHEVSERIGLLQAALSGDRFGDVVMAAAFGRVRKHLLRLMTDYAKKIDLLYKAQMAGRALTAMVVLFMLYSSAMSVLGIFSAQGEIKRLEEQKAAKEQRFSELQASTETLPDDLDRITDLVSVYETLSGDVEDLVPTNFVQRLGAVMQGKTLVKSFEWVSNENLEGGDAGSRGRSTRGRGEAPTTNQGPLEIKMKVEFVRQQGDIDDFLSTANQFFSDLQGAFQGYSISYSKLPGTISESEDMSINFDDSSALSPTLPQDEPLEVEITLKGPRQPEEKQTSQRRLKEGEVLLGGAGQER